MNKNENMISDWLDQNGDPEIEMFIAKNLAITEKVRQALKIKGWSNNRFAEELGKKPSEVSRWLSGMHNLTMKSIIKMEVLLGIDLIHTQPTKEYEYVFLGVVNGNQELISKADEYKIANESQISTIAM